MVEKAGQYRLIGLLDRFRQIGDLTLGHAVLGGEEHLPDLIQTHQIAGVIVGVGDNFVRAQWWPSHQLYALACPLFPTVHPSAGNWQRVVMGSGNGGDGGRLHQPRQPGR